MQYIFDKSSDRDSILATKKVVGHSNKTCRLLVSTQACTQQVPLTQYVMHGSLSIPLPASNEIDRLYIQVKWKAHNQWFGC